MSKETMKLNFGKFKPCKVYKVDVEASDDLNKFFVNLGKEVITEQEYFEVGIRYALEKALEEEKRKNK